LSDQSHLWIPDRLKDEFLPLYISIEATSEKPPTWFDVFHQLHWQAMSPSCPCPRPTAELVSWLLMNRLAEASLPADFSGCAWNIVSFTWELLGLRFRIEATVPHGRGVRTYARLQVSCWFNVTDEPVFSPYRVLGDYIPSVPKFWKSLTPSMVSGVVSSLSSSFTGVVDVESLFPPDWRRRPNYLTTSAEN
jgi:hypothetical protein